MKLLLITPLYPGYFDQPKAEVTYALHYFAREWLQQGHDVRIVVLWRYYPDLFSLVRRAGRRQQYSKQEVFELDGIRVLRCPLLKYPRIDYRDRAIKGAAQEILAWLKQEDFFPDAVISHMVNPALFTAHNVATRLSKPLFLGVHNTDLLALGKRAIREKFEIVRQDITGTGFRSVAIRDKYLQLVGETGPGFLVFSGVEGGVPVSAKVLAAKAARPIREFLTVGHLVPLKNIDTVIQAFALVREKTEARLRIVGVGPLYKQLHELVDSLGLKDDVEFYQEMPRADVLKLMEKADVFALVSAPETFGLVYVEALAKGCLTVGSLGEGIDGVIVHNENGFLCPPRSLSRLSKLFMDIIKMTEAERLRILKGGWDTVKGMSQGAMAHEYVKNIQLCIDQAENMMELKTSPGLAIERE